MKKKYRNFKKAETKHSCGKSIRRYEVLKWLENFYNTDRFYLTDVGISKSAFSRHYSSQFVLDAEW